MKALLYCTKGKDYLVKDYDLFEEFVEFKITKDLTNSQSLNGLSKALNGKIVAEVEIDKVEEIKPFFCENVEKFEKETCLTMKKIYEYLDIGINELLFNLTKKTSYGYALHLTNLKVFDIPLSFDKDYIYKDYKTNATLTKAPQNMCNVYDRFGNKYVLISIQPQHLCNILNGKKTIEVRRKVLNCLKEELMKLYE